MLSFSVRVLTWYDQHGRKQLPWQQDTSPYRVWVSEIMLQQTQVTTVIPYFNRFMHRFADVLSLADAHQDEVMAHWAGLGYYSRARNLHKAARMIRDDYGGIFPTSFEAVVNLPGIGRSTAGAILSLALGQRHAVLDGNVRRVLCRHQMLTGHPQRAGTLKKLWSMADELTPQHRCDAYTQAMMDLGAMVCTRTKPDCTACPIRSDCQAFASGRVADYPNKKAAKVLPEKQTTMWIITDGEKVFLEKRPDQGIWGGLWSLPEMSEDRIDVWLHEHELIEMRRKPLAIYQHTFTHYRLHILPVVVTVKASAEGTRFDRLDDIGLPTPIRRILRIAR